MSKSNGAAYQQAGVDIEAGDELVRRIKPAVERTHRAGVLGSIGGFGGLFRLGNYRDPVLVSGTDGVGTKLLIAQQLGRHNTIGIDLVAMCVNDVVVTGAEPLFFLDYYATGALDVDAAASVVEGIAAGCEQAGCALVGGETAEMPGMYGAGHYDLAGFCVGVVERDEVLDKSTVQPGDALVGLPSSGLHSNGFSLVRKIAAAAPAFDWEALVPGSNRTFADEFLLPTRIYVREVLDAKARFGLRAAAHITGGGLTGNVPRALPEGLGAALHRERWTEPPIFDWLKAHGPLTDADLWDTFNLGLGMILVVPQAHAASAAEAMGGTVVGSVVEQPGVAIS